MAFSDSSPNFHKIGLFNFVHLNAIFYPMGIFLKNDIKIVKMAKNDIIMTLKPHFKKKSIFLDLLQKFQQDSWCHFFGLGFLLGEIYKIHILAIFRRTNLQILRFP